MTNLQKIQSERILKSYGVSPIQKDIDLNIIAEKCNDSFNKGIITENEFNSAIDYFEDLMKARSVKYFKREGTAGNYKYYYSEAEYKQKKGLESKKEEDGGIKMNNLDWGSSTAERNENLDKFNSLKTKEEKESFKKELKAKNESGDKKDGGSPKSEVEKNQKLLKVGDTILSDDSKWTIVGLFDGGFTAKDDFEEKDFLFKELQLMWTLSNKTKERIEKESNIKKSDSTDPYDILKSDITYSLGNFSNPIEFSKKGSEIKDMVKTKLPVLQGKLQQCELECDLIKEQAKEKGIEVDKIYSEFESRGYAYLDESTPNIDSSDNLQLKLINLLYKKKDLKSDISTLEIVLDGIEDNKSYKLNINQIKSLKND